MQVQKKKQHLHNASVGGMFVSQKR